MCMTLGWNEMRTSSIAPKNQFYFNNIFNDTNDATKSTN